MRLVLASASPRRTQLLRSWGVPHDVLAADVDESAIVTLAPAELVVALAAAKARAVADVLAPSIADSDAVLILGADTVVALDGETLGKPRDAADACRMLRLLSGGRPTVATGVALLSASGRELDRRVVEARLTMRSFDEEEIQAYVATGEPMDKAGAFAVQGEGRRLIAAISGPKSAVVGLPRDAVLAMLAAQGFPVAPADAPDA